MYNQRPHYEIKHAHQTNTPLTVRIKKSSTNMAPNGKTPATSDLEKQEKQS